MAILRKMTCNLRHPMSLRHPVSTAILRVNTRSFLSATLGQVRRCIYIYIYYIYARLYTYAVAPCQLHLGRYVDVYIYIYILYLCASTYIRGPSCGSWVSSRPCQLHYWAGMYIIFFISMRAYILTRSLLSEPCQVDYWVGMYIQFDMCTLGQVWQM